MKRCVQVIALLSMLALDEIAAQSSSIPTLTIKNNTEESVTLEELDIRVEVLDNIAVTFMEMTFYNSGDRVLEGELNFPLQDNVTLSHFAMDVNGKMRNGVVVEKSKGTEVFETIVNRRVDPGLLQKSEGNSFKARIYPIPAKGYKRIQLAYEHSLKCDGKNYLYQLPMTFEKAIKRLNVRAEVLNQAIAPQIVDSQQVNIQFQQQNNGFIASYETTNFIGQKQIGFKLPVNTTSTLASSSKGAIESNETFFYLNTLPPSTFRDKPKPSKITLYYDMSGSLVNRDMAKEFALLDRYFNWAQDVEVRLITFALDIELDTTLAIKKGTWQNIKAILNPLVPDGATQYSHLQIDTSHGDEILLFTDGLVNFGKEEQPTSNTPLFIINSSPKVNSNSLNSMAQKNSGVYINLVSTTISEAAKLLMSQKIHFLYAEYDHSELSEVFPSTPTYYSQNLPVLGKLHSSSAKITLHFGYNNSSSYQQSFIVNKNNPIKAGLIERLWIEKVVENLEINPQDNRLKIIDLGERYQIVTSLTSLIVLETIEDYLQYRIVPPAEMQAEYYERIKQFNQDDKRSSEEYLQSIVSDFNTKVMWYENGCPKVMKQKVDTSEPVYMMAEREEVVEASNNLRDVPPPPPVLRNTISFTTPMIRPDNEMVIEEEVSSTDFDSGTDDVVAEENQISDVEVVNSSTSTILVTEWNPNDPFIDSLKMLSTEKIYQAYLQKRAASKDVPPALFLDVSSLLYQRNQKESALKVLSNLAESTDEQFDNLRILGRKFIEFEEYDYAIEVFQKVVSIRPFEAHSYRDLGLALSAKKEYQKSIETLYTIIRDSKLNVTAGFTSILVGEMNNIMFHSDTSILIPDFDPRLAKHQPVDIRIVLEWDAANTDMDLWVTDPNGEKCSYEHNRTKICGYLSPDNTSGYGPEEFLLKKAIPGKYIVEVNYYGTRSQKISKPITVQMLMYINYGRVNETVQRTTLRLTNKREVVKIGELNFMGSEVVDMKSEAKPDLIFMLYLVAVAAPLLISMGQVRLRERKTVRLLKGKK